MPLQTEIKWLAAFGDTGGDTDVFVLAIVMGRDPQIR